MDKRKTTAQARKLQPFMANIGGNVVIQALTAAEGPGIDIPDGTGVIGLGGDSVLLYQANGSPVREFATCTLACAAAAAGDVISIAKPGTFTESFTIPAGVHLVGISRGITIIGTVLLSNGCTIEGIAVAPAASSSSPLIGIGTSGSGASDIYNCHVTPVNSGSGGVQAVAVVDIHDLNVHESFLDGRGNAGGGLGYAGYRFGGGNLRIEGGTCLGASADDPFNE